MAAGSSTAAATPVCATNGHQGSQYDRIDKSTQSCDTLNMDLGVFIIRFLRERVVGG